MNYINKWMQVVEQWQNSNNEMAQFVDEMIRNNKQNYIHNLDNSYKFKQIVVSNEIIIVIDKNDACFNLWHLEYTDIFNIGFAFYQQYKSDN